MEIRKVIISEINPAPYNPRRELKPGDPAYERLKKSIEKFGIVDPLIWNERTKTLVSGHQRLKILLEMGAIEVDASVVNLSVEDERILNLTINRNQGEWDREKLAEILAPYFDVPDFDLDLTGFDAGEATKIIDEYQEEDEEDDFNIGAAMASIQEPITKSGDLIVLGKHKLLCGDSSDSAAVVQLLAGEKVRLIFSDPPYRASYKPLSGRGKSGDARFEMIKNDDLSQEDYEALLSKVFSNVLPHLHPETIFYLWNGHAQFYFMYQILSKLGFKVSNVITWMKESFSFGFCDYKNQTEQCLYGWLEGSGPHVWYGPKNETSLWQINRASRGSYQHPTTKPIQLASRALRNSSRRGDIVLDMFLGSGTTLLAAEQLGRVCCGIEIDPRFCDVIVRRYIAHVGLENVTEEIRMKYCKAVSHAE